MGEAYTPPSYGSEGQPIEALPAQEKKSKTGLIIGIVIGVLILCCCCATVIAVAGYYISQSGGFQF